MAVQTVDRADGDRSTGVARTKADRTTSVDRWLALMNQAIDESDWSHKQDALATNMGIDKAYLSRLRSGDKPWRVEHVVGLPAEIEGRFVDLRAESFGRIVVRPASGPDAIKQFVSGLFGVLTDKKVA